MNLTENQIQRAFRATAGCLFVIGLVIPSMLAQMPIIRERLDLTEDRISWFILAMGLGAVPSMLTSGFVLARLGSRRGALIFFPLMLMVPPFMGLLDSYAALLTLGVILGILSGFVDVTANTHGSLIERLTGRLFMTSIHAYFALGVLIGAGLSALNQYNERPIWLFLGELCLISLILWFFIWRDFISFEVENGLEAEESSVRGKAFPRGSIILLAALSLLMLLGIVAEAAHYDWLALYTLDVFFQPEGGWVSEEATREVAHWGSIGVMVFSAGLLLARLLGDHLAARLGRPWLLFLFSVLGCLSLLTLVLAPSYAIALPAMFFMGIGFAMFFPIFIASAGRLKGIPAAFGVSLVAAMGWCAIFIGPPMIGFVAEHYDYRMAYATLLPPAIFVAILGPFVVYKSRVQNH